MLAIFLFYNTGYGMQKIFTTKGLCHCNVICYDGSQYTLFATDWHGIHYRSISATNTLKLLHKLQAIPSLEGLLCAHVHEPHQLAWSPLALRSCNELCRYVTGVHVGVTFNPTHLAKKLLKYDNKRNYEIIHQWWSPSCQMKTTK